jgi:hypothetical protein
VEIVLTEIAGPRLDAPSERAAAPASAAAGMNEVLALEVSQKYVRLDEFDYYALLGIEREAAPAAIKRAYLDAAKRFHPDALARAGLDRETREKAGPRVRGDRQGARGARRPEAPAQATTRRSTRRDGPRRRAARRGRDQLPQGRDPDASRATSAARSNSCAPRSSCGPRTRPTRARSAGRCSRPRRPTPCARARTSSAALALEPRNIEITHRLSLVLKALGEGRAGREPREPRARARPDPALARQRESLGELEIPFEDLGWISHVVHEVLAGTPADAAPRSPTRTSARSGALRAPRCAIASTARVLPGGSERRSINRARRQRIDRLHRRLLERLRLLLVVELLAPFRIESVSRTITGAACDRMALESQRVTELVAALPSSSDAASSTGRPQRSRSPRRRSICAETEPRVQHLGSRRRRRDLAVDRGVRPLRTGVPKPHPKPAQLPRPPRSADPGSTASHARSAFSSSSRS